MTVRAHNRPLHRIALLTAAATFPLIFIGGLVTSHGAGMAVPDWPNSYGYNMFLFPPSKWVGGIWYEHVHRLYASFVGLLSIVLCVMAWKTDRRRHVRWLATAVLLSVIFQGVLGGLRVVLVELDLAVVHGCVAQAFFCLAALTALVTGRWWADAPDLSAAKDAIAGRRLVRLAVVAVVLIYGQLVVGAFMRHYGAGLSIPDFPLAYGKLLPPITQEELATQFMYGPTFSIRNVWLHYGHRIGAVVVSLAVILLVLRVFRLHRGRPSLLLPALLLILLLLTQLTLGALTVLLRKPADVASAHVAVGALLLVTTFAMAARAVRLYRPRTATADEPAGAFEVVRPAIAPNRPRGRVVTT